MSLDRTLQRVWYERSPLILFLLLAPLSVLFGLVAAARRFAFRIGLLRRIRVERPVIVVGNITVGGTGKTPLVIWICDYLRERGVRVGVITRGYGGSAAAWPQDVTRKSSASAVGDEAVLIAARTDAIVVASPDRVEAASRAIARGADVIVSDDGLQHYRLARDAEIVVVDANRALGNGWLIPAGPLREPSRRLRTADLVVATSRGSGMNASLGAGSAITLRHEIVDAQCLTTGERRALEAFAGTTVHAIAGIGNPDAFFSMLRAHTLDVVAHALPDHAVITPADVAFTGTAPILMTEKDAVKCTAFATERLWVVPLRVRFDDSDARRIGDLLSRVAKPEHSIGPQTVKP